MTPLTVGLAGRSPDPSAQSLKLSLQGARPGRSGGSGIRRYLNNVAEAEAKGRAAWRKHIRAIADASRMKDAPPHPAMEDEAKDVVRMWQEADDNLRQTAEELEQAVAESEEAANPTNNPAMLAKRVEEWQIRQDKYERERIAREDAKYGKGLNGMVARHSDEALAASRTARDASSNVSAGLTRIRGKADPAKTAAAKQAAKKAKKAAKAAKKAAKKADDASRSGGHDQIIEAATAAYEARDAAEKAAENALKALREAEKSAEERDKDNEGQNGQPGAQPPVTKKQPDEDRQPQGEDPAGPGADDPEGEGPGDGEGDGRFKTKECPEHEYPNCPPCTCEPPCKDKEECECTWVPGGTPIAGRGPYGSSTTVLTPAYGSHGPGDIVVTRAFPMGSESPVFPDRPAGSKGAKITRAASGMGPASPVSDVSAVIVPVLPARPSERSKPRNELNKLAEEHAIQVTPRLWIYFKIRKVDDEEILVIKYRRKPPVTPRKPASWKTFVPKRLEHEKSEESKVLKEILEHAEDLPIIAKAVEALLSKERYALRVFSQEEVARTTAENILASEGPSSDFKAKEAAGPTTGIVLDSTNRLVPTDRNTRDLVAVVNPASLRALNENMSGLTRGIPAYEDTDFENLNVGIAIELSVALRYEEVTGSGDPGKEEDTLKDADDYINKGRACPAAVTLAYLNSLPGNRIAIPRKCYVPRPGQPNASQGTNFGWVEMAKPSITVDMPSLLHLAYLPSPSVEERELIEAGLRVVPWPYPIPRAQWRSLRASAVISRENEKFLLAYVGVDGSMVTATLINSDESRAFRFQVVGHFDQPEYENQWDYGELLRRWEAMAEHQGSAAPSPSQLTNQLPRKNIRTDPLALLPHTSQVREERESQPREEGAPPRPVPPPPVPMFDFEVSRIKTIGDCDDETPWWTQNNAQGWPGGS